MFSTGSLTNHTCQNIEAERLRWKMYLSVWLSISLSYIHNIMKVHFITFDLGFMLLELWWLQEYHLNYSGGWHWRGNMFQKFWSTFIWRIAETVITFQFLYYLLGWRKCLSITHRFISAESRFLFIFINA